MSRTTREARERTRAGLLALVVGVMVVAAAVYVRVGWWRMESACSLDNASGSTHESVAYGWSWQPLGFQCTYDDGAVETSLWF